MIKQHHPYVASRIPFRYPGIVVSLALEVLCAFILTALPAAAEEYYISRLPARFVPRRVVKLNMPQTGEVEIICKERRAKQGDLVMRLNPEEAEWADTEFSLELQHDEVQFQEELLQLQRQQEELTFVSELPPEQRIYLRNKLAAQADARAVSLLDKKIALLREKAAAQQKHKQDLHAQQKAKSELRMPFDGVLEIHVQGGGRGENRIPVASGAPLVTVADDSELYLGAAIMNSEWANLPASRLLLKWEAAGAAPLSACWHHRCVEKTERSEGLVYYFSVPEAQKAQAWNLLGTQLVAKLYYVGDDVLYLRKDEVVKAADGLVFETWAEFVRHVFPGYRILFCGETHLALVQADAS